jgi:hypothetical protein
MRGYALSSLCSYRPVCKTSYPLYKQGMIGIKIDSYNDIKKQQSVIKNIDNARHTTEQNIYNWLFEEVSIYKLCATNKFLISSNYWKSLRLFEWKLKVTTNTAPRFWGFCKMALRKGKNVWKVIYSPLFSKTHAGDNGTLPHNIKVEDLKAIYSVYVNDKILDVPKMWQNERL